MTQSSSPPPLTALDRRALLASGGGLVLAGLLGMPAFAISPDLGDAAEFRGRVQSFLALLAPEEAARARFPYGGDVQKSWNFMGGGGFIKPGLRLEEMSEAQKQAAWHMLSAVLSPRGIEKTRNVMSLQRVLMDRGDGVSTRGPERYSIAIFGEPKADSDWALRFEGHHLSLTFSIAKDRLAGVTPSSFSVNPNRVEGGSYNGLVTLKREDSVARRLAADLSSAARQRAFFMESPLRNVRALAGREQPFEKREGIAIGDLGSAQRDLLIEVIDAFVAEHLQPVHAAAVAARIQSGDAAATHFAFSGSTKVGEPAYYRIHGDALLIEFASVDAAAQHLHTVFHLS
jgi:hypothetical protein